MVFLKYSIFLIYKWWFMLYSYIFLFYLLFVLIKYRRGIGSCLFILRLDYI